MKDVLVLVVYYVCEVAWVASMSLPIGVLLLFCYCMLAVLAHD